MKRETLKPFLCCLLGVVCGLGLLGCSKKPEANTLVMIIESSPTNLDPRVGIDAYSERIDELLFDALVHRDEHFNLQPWLATSWDIPDPLTYVFHLRSGVRFHDGHPLTARDVKWTFDSIMNRTMRTVKTGTYRFVDHVDAPDDTTVIFHLKEPWASLLWNVANDAIGIVPFGSGGDFYRNPVGSGPFRLVRNQQDREVVLERNDQYWRDRPRIPRVRMIVVPDTTTRALELRKGSADVALNALTADMVLALRKDPSLEVQQTPGTVLNYVALNLRDPILRDPRVRQALAYALDRRPLIHYLWRDEARPAYTILPPQSWAFSADLPAYDFNPQRARDLLDVAGYPARNGMRFHLTMKTSTEENSRLLAAVLQQQWRAVGVELDIKTFEFATFFSDVQKGAFQLYPLRWIGGNNDPDMFQYAFHSAFTPPAGANRSYYANPEVDRLIDLARRELDPQKRKQMYLRIQQLLAQDLPYLNLWYLDNVVVHSRRTANFQISPAGNYDFLTTVELKP
ncbi:MAG: ABC transporter substrate-binding protein [Terriglobales bacterium]